jgi:hypothetical protein
MEVVEGATCNIRIDRNRVDRIFFILIIKTFRNLIKRSVRDGT